MLNKMWSIDGLINIGAVMTTQVEGGVQFFLSSVPGHVKTFSWGRSTSVWLCLFLDLFFQMFLTYWKNYNFFDPGDTGRAALFLHKFGLFYPPGKKAKLFQDILDKGNLELQRT